jgi:hypothetical protein
MNNDVVAQVLLLVTRTDDTGRPLYVNAEIRHIIPLVVLEVGMDLTTLPDKVRAIVDETALLAGVRAGMSSDEVIAAFQKHYAKFPPNAQLVADIARVLQENVSAGGQAMGMGTGATGAMAAVLGTEKITGVLGGGERPKGTVPGGLAAQLAARAAPKKKS